MGERGQSRKGVTGSSWTRFSTRSSWPCCWSSCSPPPPPKPTLAPGLPLRLCSAFSSWPSSPLQSWDTLAGARLRHAQSKSARYKKERCFGEKKKKKKSFFGEKKKKKKKKK